MAPDAPPALSAVLAPGAARTSRLRLLLRPAELEQLKGFARAAGVPAAQLGHALVVAGLQQLGQAHAEQVLHQQEAA